MASRRSTRQTKELPNNSAKGKESATPENEHIHPKETELFTLLFNCKYVGSQHLLNSRLVTKSWNRHILRYPKFLPQVHVGHGYEEEDVEKQNNRLVKLRTLLDSSAFPFQKYFFGRVLDFSKVQEFWEKHGSRMTQVTVDCHEHPEHTDVTPEFTTEHLISLMENCGPTLEKLRINLPWKVLESKTIFQKNDYTKKEKCTLHKCTSIVIQNKHMHNFCETHYAPIDKGWWMDFYNQCPKLTKLKIDMDLDPENTKSFSPMLYAIKDTVSKQLTSLKLHVQITDDELKTLNKLKGFLTLNTLELTRFHCTAKANGLAEFINNQKSWLEQLKLYYHFYYDSSEIEYENYAEPDFGECQLPPMSKLKRLTLSVDNEGPFFCPKPEDMPSLQEYTIFMSNQELDAFEPDSFLHMILPESNDEEFESQVCRVTLCNIPQSFEEAEVIEEQAMNRFPKATFFKKNRSQMRRQNYEAYGFGERRE